MKMFPKRIYKKRKPSLASRGKFSHKVIAEILKRDSGSCVVCFSEADDIHHVVYKSKMGRGVFTNGLSLCRTCHDLAHSSQDERKRLENIMIEKYGSNYYKDSWD